MKQLARKNPAAPARRNQPTARDISQELAQLSGAAKAQLVMEYLGIPKDKIGAATSETPVARTLRKPPSKELLHRLLAELASDMQSSGQRTVKNPVEAPPTAPKEPRPSNPNRRSDAPKLPERDLTPLLFGQNPSVAAVILSALSTTQAASILQTLPPKSAQRIALCVASIETGGQTVPANARHIIGQCAC